MSPDEKLIDETNTPEEDPRSIEALLRIAFRLSVVMWIVAIWTIAAAIGTIIAAFG